MASPEEIKKLSFSAKVFARFDDCSAASLACNLSDGRSAL